MGAEIVRDVMVPLAEYATVRDSATLFDAVLALEEAQDNFDKARYRHRALLVLDANRRVVGKISQLNSSCCGKSFGEIRRNFARMT